MDWKPEKDTDSGKIVSEYEYISFFWVTFFLICLLKLWPTVRCQEKFCLFVRCKLRFWLFLYTSKYIRILKIVPVITCRMTSSKLPCRLCIVTMQPLQWNLDITKDLGLTIYVRYDEVSLYRVSIPYILLLLGRGISYVIPRTSLYKCSLIEVSLYFWSFCILFYLFILQSKNSTV